MMQDERELYQVEQLPVFQNLIYDSALDARECPCGNVRLVQNTSTGLVYNADFRPELVTYDIRYQNEQGVSETFRRHLDAVVQIVERTMGRSRLVEVGCGKGYFLEILSKSGFDVIGFDPTYEGNNPHIRRSLLGAGDKIAAKGLILRHVLEHVPNPLQFLQDLRATNAGSGLIYIEVPCFDWICANRNWFDVFYEHVNYFRLVDFERIFDNIIEKGRLFNDQYLYVVAELGSLKSPLIDHRGYLTLPDDFFRNPSVSETHTVQVVWGGSSKGVIYSLLRSRLGHPVSYIIDINPAKQGKYLPATGLKVHSPDEGLAKLPTGGIIYVMNSNYLEEIQKMSNHDYRYVCVDHE